MNVKRIAYKTKNKSGFSLAETLMAVLILLLVSSVIAAGIPAAASAYKNAVDGANARALLSATVNALRGELSTAWGVEVSPPGHTGEIFYYSSRTGAKTRLYNDSATNTIKVQDYIQYNSYDLVQDPDTNKWRYLVPESMSKKTKNSAEKFDLSFINPGKSSDVVSLTVKVGTGEALSIPLAIRLIDSDFRVPELP